MPTASDDDVRVEIETYLDDPDIRNIIERVDREITRSMDTPPDEGTDERRDLESVLSALFIAETRDRAESSSQTGRTSVTYEDSLLESLRSRARLLGAPEELIGTTGQNYKNLEVF